MQRFRFGLRIFLLYAPLSLVFLFGGIRAYAQAPQPEIRELQARLERIAGTDLPDFAPEALRSLQASVRKLELIAAETGSVPAEDLQRAQHDLDAFETLAMRTRASIGRAFPLRNTALQSNFVRGASPAQLARAEDEYQAARALAAEGRFGEARQRASRAASQYETLIRAAQARAKQELGATLERYQVAIRTDLAALTTGSSAPPDVAGMEIVARKISPGNHGFDINGTGLGIYDPPLPDPPGPQTADVFIETRGANSIGLWWFDRSDDETGNRIMRTTDLLNWEAIRDLPPIPRLTESRHTDTNLQPDRQVCYAIESFNALGTRRGQIRCAYTRPANDIAVWRMELRVTVADLPNAGTDATPVATIGTTGTYLDYGRNDFQRNRTDVFDLNLGDIRWVSDITELALYNGAVEDKVLIEEITLLVNQRVAFSQHWGATTGSALQVGTLQIGHDELRANPAWQEYVQKSLIDKTFNLPRLLPGNERGLVIQIPKDQIVSRIESIVGHTLHNEAALRGHLRWGFLHGPAVEIEQVRANAVHVDLDTEATLDLLPNPEVDIDFDLVVGKRCEADKLLLDLSTENATTDADFTWWKDILSGGILPAGLAVHEACSGNPDVPSIRQTVEMAMKKTACDALDVHSTPARTSSYVAFRSTR